MTARKAERIAIENAVSPGRVVQVDAAKYGDMKRAVLTVLAGGQPSLTVAELKAQVLPLLSDALFPGGDKAGWWLKAVQLDLEAKGLLAREPTRPVRLHRTR